MYVKSQFTHAYILQLVRLTSLPQAIRHHRRPLQAFSKGAPGKRSPPPPSCRRLFLGTVANTRVHTASHSHSLHTRKHTAPIGMQVQSSKTIDCKVSADNICTYMQRIQCVHVAEMRRACALPLITGGTAPTRYQSRGSSIANSKK